MENKDFWKIGVGIIVVAYIVIILLGLLVYLECRLSLGDLFSFGQLLVELILLPTVIVGFIIAITEFRANQQLPIPQLYWEQGNEQFAKSTELMLPQGNTFVQTPRLVLKNEGKAVTSWYLVRFEISKEIYRENEPRIERLIGEPLKSVDQDSHWYPNTSMDKHIWSFMSNNKFALYPNYPQPLCSISLYFEKSKIYPEICTIPFVIYSDKGKEIKGELKIKFVKSEQS